MKALALLLVITACGGKPSTEPAHPRPDPQPAAGAEWWCLSFNKDMNGICLAGKPACEAMLGKLQASATDPDEKLGDCSRVAHPVCLDKTASGKTEQVCHPTFATCRSHAEHFKNDGATVTECRSSDPKAAAEPRWWCVAYEPAGVGSCSRSQKDCEDSRDFLRGKLPGEKIACAAQQTAECFEFEGKSGGKRSLCHPNTALCKGTIATMAEDGKQAVSECHTVE